MSTTIFLKKQNSATIEQNLPHIFSALSDPGRFQIFKLLLEQEDICVSQVAVLSGISVPAASRQLKILELTGLVRRERRGQTICYKIQKKDPLIKAIIKLVKM